MHDIDRSLMEYEPEMNEGESEDEYEAEYETEYEDEYDDEYDDEDESYEAVFDEQEEMEMAAELLGLTEEAELDYFLRKLVRKVGRKARRFVKSKTGRRLRRILRKVAKKSYPSPGVPLGPISVVPREEQLVAPQAPLQDMSWVWNLKV